LRGPQRRSAGKASPPSDECYYYSVAQLINPSSVHNIAVAIDDRISRRADKRDRLEAFHSGLLAAGNDYSGRCMKYLQPYCPTGRKLALDERC